MKGVTNGARLSFLASGYMACYDRAEASVNRRISNR